MKTSRLILLIGLLLGCSTVAFAKAPRIVNIVNFVRQNDYRVENSEAKLFEATQKELELVREYNLPATFLLQYDALIDTRYQELFAERDKNIEIGAWWELTQPQIEAAGIKWRGDHRWVSTANIAFTTGYTQQERKQLVDVYMKKFQEVFGCYPKSVGSWYIDAWTLNYMEEKYHIVASCNCKDQIGTDGYTLWGGYWNGAYYPSKVNGYMPAQTMREQVNVPVFRMLGSDPIYQYDQGLGGNGQGVITLEPVYPHAGGNKQWTETFLNALADEPCLAFNYTQAGQENSFTWPEIRNGLTMQIPIIAEMQKEGRVQVWTLEECGRWFRKSFKQTPATAFTMTTDPQQRGNMTVWYNCKNYRCNVMIDKNGELRFRDIHVFDEKMKSLYHDTPGTTSHFTFETLPIVDGQQWSRGNEIAGLRLVKIVGGKSSPMCVGPQTVNPCGKQSVMVVESGDGEELLLLMSYCGKPFFILITPEGITAGVTSQYKVSRYDGEWALELTTADVALPFTAITPQSISAEYLGQHYGITTKAGHFERPASEHDYVWRVYPDKGVIEINVTTAPR